MAHPTLLEAVSAGPLLFDGAIGTQLRVGRSGDSGGGRAARPKQPARDRQGPDLMVHACAAPPLIEAMEPWTRDHRPRDGMTALLQPRRALATVLAFLATCLVLACDSSPRPCESGPEMGTVSLWLDCEDRARNDASLPVTLTNGTAERAWYYHHCQDEVPWPEVLQTDGTWLRLLPTDFFLPVSCHHVLELAPSESVELALSTARTTAPGMYRAVMPVAFGCELHIHEPIHVPHSCERVDFIPSEPFELR